MNTPFKSDPRKSFYQEFVEHYNEMAELTGRPLMEYIPPPEQIIEELADEFDRLASTEIDAREPKPIYVSRMQFRDWAETLRDARDAIVRDHHGGDFIP